MFWRSGGGSKFWQYFRVQAGIEQLTALVQLFIHGRMMKLDHRSSIPLRAQVEQVLRELVLVSKYQKGALLPDEVKLAAQLGVSRGTVRSGISMLVFEGILERKAGIGTRVSNRRVESGIRAWRSFTEEMEAKGIKVKNFSLTYRLVPASVEAARALQLNPGTEVWRLDRVRGWNGKPVLITTSWFHPRLGLKGGEDFSLKLYHTLEQLTGVQPHHAREGFLAMTADAQRAKLLRVPAGSPLLLREHTVFDPGNRPFEYAEVRYVSSRFTLTMELRRSEI
jgi:GntR family transcriptional regulator